MKIKIISLFIFVSFALNAQIADLKLWYETPAQNWNEALPIGNGHIGAMIFGDVNNEHWQLNDNTLYSGDPSVYFKNVTITNETFQEVVKLMKEQKYPEASQIICKNWLGRLHQYYQPFGDLFIKNNVVGKVQKYRRELDISNAVTKVEYEQNGTGYQREVFASNPDNLIIARMKGNKHKSIDITIHFESTHPTAHQFYADKSLLLDGKAPGYVERRTFEQIESWGDQYKHPELYTADGKRKFNHRVLYGNEIGNKGMPFEGRLKVVFPTTGKMEMTSNGLHIYDTDDVCLYLSLATGFNGFDKNPCTEGVDPSAKTKSIINHVLASKYETLKNRHILNYESLFNRVHLNLYSAKDRLNIPTDQRIIEFSKQNDPALAALLFQFGRYLMISGSRPGGQPLNLQGIWNKDSIPAWNSGYTININTEMNYWPAELTNLSGCHEPLFKMIEELAVNGREVAQKMYGRRGWVAHHNTSIWREAMPNDNVPSASFWPMSQGWLCSHLWEHYLFTGDEKFLRNRAYPLMKGAAEFFADWLIDDGNGHLVTPAGISPENSFAYNGENSSLSMGSTMDMSIIRETFQRVIQMSEKFNVDKDLCNELKGKLKRLLPYQIGAKGQLQEWMYDFDEPEPTHRHLSHLYGFYPGNQITWDQTPRLIDAVKKTMAVRGDAATGWSLAWKINIWARLLDGNHAYKIIRNLFNPIDFGDSKRGGGGLYKNLLDGCPPFQIDGNFGFTAGVAEMLVQSQAGFIHLLPALPSEWSEGDVSGLKARGNFEVAVSWSKGYLTKAVIKSIIGNRCVLRYEYPFTVNSINLKRSSVPVKYAGKTYYQLAFNTKPNQVYKIACVK